MSKLGTVLRQENNQQHFNEHNDLRICRPPHPYYGMLRSQFQHFFLCALHQVFAEEALKRGKNPTEVDLQIKYGLGSWADYVRDQGGVVMERVHESVPSMRCAGVPSSVQDFELAKRIVLKTLGLEQVKTRNPEEGGSARDG
jgi:hypothetical protein